MGGMTFFSTPGEMVEHEKSTKKAVESTGSRYFLPLQGTLGWCEMEEAMWDVLQRMASADDDWLMPVDLTGVDDVTAYDPGTGVRRFTEYFDSIKGHYYIGSEALVKLHRGIGKRSEDGTH